MNTFSQDPSGYCQRSNNQSPVDWHLKVSVDAEVKEPKSMIEYNNQHAKNQFNTLTQQILESHELNDHAQF